MGRWWPLGHPLGVLKMCGEGSRITGVLDRSTFQVIQRHVQRGRWGGNRNMESRSAVGWKSMWKRWPMADGRDEEEGNLLTLTPET